MVSVPNETETPDSFLAPIGVCPQRDLGLVNLRLRRTEH